MRNVGRIGIAVIHTCKIVRPLKRKSDWIPELVYPSHLLSLHLDHVIFRDPSRMLYDPLTRQERQRGVTRSYGLSNYCRALQNKTLACVQGTVQVVTYTLLGNRPRDHRRHLPFIVF